MPGRSNGPAAAILALLVAAGPLAAVATGLASHPAGARRDDPLRAPAGPTLDERIDGSKITTLDPPALPQRIVQPAPAVHRIAAEPDRVPISPEHHARAMVALERGLAFLRSQQGASGGWLVDASAAPTDQPDAPSPVATAVTAMVLKGIVQADESWLEDESARRAIGFVRAQQDDDGSFRGGALTNYVTSIAVSALASLDDPRVAELVEGGKAWLMASQWDQGEGLDVRADWFGGAGYGGHGRPDLSNTQMMLDALHDAGVSPEEPAMQRALAFVSRAQNLRATNPAPWAGDDGGFVYTPANGGESMGSQAAGEGRYGEHMPEGTPRALRSYGSMTYAGFKSMLYAGLDPSDVRVRAAFDWIRRHFTFDENPGLGQQGLYYYYHTMSRALVASQQHEIETGEGDRRNWREALVDALAERQRADGSWKNDADRWLEGEPVLATAYAVLALEEVLKPAILVEQSGQPTGAGDDPRAPGEGQ